MILQCSSILMIAGVSVWNKSAFVRVRLVFCVKYLNMVLFFKVSQSLNKDFFKKYYAFFQSGCDVNSVLCELCMSKRRFFFRYRLKKQTRFSFTI
jgi:hypothetical protein